MGLRGMYLVTVDLVTHEVISSQIFDTHKLDMDVRNFFDALREVEDQRMVIMAVSDEGSGKLG